VIVDGDVGELPSGALASAAGLALVFTIAGNAMADSIEAAELLISIWMISPGVARS
jgi:hypothetical protein